MGTAVCPYVSCITDAVTAVCPYSPCIGDGVGLYIWYGGTYNPYIGDGGAVGTVCMVWGDRIDHAEGMEEPYGWYIWYGGDHIDHT